MKKCPKCKKEKDFNDFHKHKRSKDGLACRCKECSLDDKKEYYEKNKEKVREKVKNYREANLEKVKETVKSHYEKNRDSLLEYKKKYHIDTEERRKDLNFKWREENRDRIKEYAKEYISDKRKNDVLFKIKDRISGLIRSSIVSKGYKKLHKTEIILGCTITEFKNYIESKFVEGMNWDNHGEWHMDHKTPVSWAKNEIEIYELNHYTNFQPLWNTENLIKGNRWEG
jgi:hypothetical protein